MKFNPEMQLVPAVPLAGVLLILILSSAGCRGSVPPPPLPIPTSPPATREAQPFATRPLYDPGELVDYTAQSGDTLPALEARFNTTVKEILQANPIIPPDVTTMPPGLPMKIPIYYLPFWGSTFHILPDEQFANGPAQVGFDTREFIAQFPGWLNRFSDFVAGEKRNGAETVDYVAQNFSISPRLLLALLEYQTGALSESEPPANLDDFPLGWEIPANHGLYLQLVFAANRLNNGFYGWRTGTLTGFDLLDQRIERPDPWQNAATVALQYYFAGILNPGRYPEAISEAGFSQVYRSLFGDPWESEAYPIPGNLRQPPMRLPFEDGKTWAFTGGPHTGWGRGEPLAALDFAPPSEQSGCFKSGEWVVAVAPGTVVRSETGVVVLDLDNDGDERTGWVVFYLHLATADRAPKGAVLAAGEPVGHPSCEGGSSTGTHVHIARKYNGEWIPAWGPLAFNLEGWLAFRGDESYQGSLKNFTRTVTACDCANTRSQIRAGE